MGEDDVRRRRTAILEAVSLAVPIGAAVVSSGLLVADWPLVTGVLTGVVTALMAAACWGWHRHLHPAEVRAPEPAVPDGPAGAAEGDDGRWDWFTLALLVVSVVALVVVSVLVMFLVPLVVIAAFAVLVDGAGVRDVLLAVGVTLGAALALEVAVTLPLSRRWSIPRD